MRTAPLLLAFLSGFSTSFSQTTGGAPGSAATPISQTEIKDKYHLAQVDQFEVKQGVEFPAEYLKNLQWEISKQLTDAKIFGEVLQPGQQPAHAEMPVIRLSGTIHNYRQGNRKKRYLAGFGAGAAEIDAQVTFLDGATGQQLVTEELRGVLTGGFLGGKAEQATQELARQVVTQAKLMLARRLPPPAEAGTASSDTAKSTAATAAADRHKLTIDAKKWSEGEQKLGQEAAAGYRVISLSLTGSFTADLELEKSAVPPDVYQYRWLHPRLATHLQKDVNKAAAEGFHASIHTLTVLGSCASVLMEKPPTPSAIRHEYVVAEPIRISSAQKDTEKHQGEGYTLLDETELGAMHILLFEKTIEEAKK